jgi:hypothetical protein
MYVYFITSMHGMRSVYVKSIILFDVIPAKAGICFMLQNVDARFRGHDDEKK